MKRRYTLCFHEYIGYGSYVISFKRVFCKPDMLERHKRNSSLHFIIPGWPKLTFPDGTPYFDKKGD